MHDLELTVTHATPSYLLHLHQAIENSEWSREEFKWHSNYRSRTALRRIKM